MPPVDINSPEHDIHTRGYLAAAEMRATMHQPTGEPPVMVRTAPNMPTPPPWPEAAPLKTAIDGITYAAISLEDYRLAHRCVNAFVGATDEQMANIVPGIIVDIANALHNARATVELLVETVRGMADVTMSGNPEATTQAVAAARQLVAAFDNMAAQAQPA